MYVVDFDVAWDAFHDHEKNRFIPIEAQMRRIGAKYGVELTKINYNGPGGGNPNIFVTARTKEGLRKFLTKVLCGPDATDDDVDAYVEPYLERVMDKA